MHRPLHAIGPMAGRRMSPERMAGIGFVVLLHVVAIWALVTGMIPGVVPKQPPPLVFTPIPPTVEHPTPPAPPAPPIAAPDTPTAQPPDVPIAGDSDHAIVVRHDPAPPQPVAPVGPQVAPDTPVAGVVSTHTTPDYPALARKLGEQGRVLLRLGIGADGAVTGATVEQSSGYADLDQTAVAWVIAHWRYKPAMQAGAAVAGTTRAVVVFNLKNAR